MDEKEKAEETPLCLQLRFDVVREAGTQFYKDKHHLSRGSHYLCDSEFNYHYSSVSSRSCLGSTKRLDDKSIMLDSAGPEAVVF